jgi:hypothetical protein
MMRTIKILLVAVALLVAAFIIGRCSAPKYEAETQVVERVDTMVVRDTVIREKPVYRTEYVFVRDSVRVQVHDTVFINLPRQMRVYQDSLYRAEVSGVDPTLDRIEVYPQTKFITRTETQTISVTVRKKWGIGVQVGYGITKQGASFYPGSYIGVGISYNILTF